MGNKVANLRKAMESIEEHIGSVKRQSKIYQTDAWGRRDQDFFLNQVLIVSTEKNAQTILESCLDIEQSMGRIRSEKWMERIIDIDILYFNEDIINTEILSVPHPEIQNRRFTLEPLTELIPEFVHPVFGQTNSNLLNECTDDLEVNEFIN
ncbi:MAG: 2-amino-4-hydroxy-6-hydroxymethyldihydropteridine diphosphokinase [Cyclobacteriaceae bacterium]